MRTTISRNSSNHCDGMPKIMKRICQILMEKKRIMKRTRTNQMEEFQRTWWWSFDCIESFCCISRSCITRIFLQFLQINNYSSLFNNPMLKQQLSQHRFRHYGISRTHLGVRKQSQLAKLGSMKSFLRTF